MALSSESDLECGGKHGNLVGGLGMNDKQALECAKGLKSYCDEYAEKDSRIKVLHKQNGGLVSARKAGVRLATGDYILNVDGDDWIDKDRILNAVEILITEKVDMLYLGDYYRDYMEEKTLIADFFCQTIYRGKQIGDEFFPLFQNPQKAFERKVRPILWQWLVDSSLMKQYQLSADESISRGEDAILVWECVLHARSVAVCHNPTYHYVQRETSLSYTIDDDEVKRMKVYVDRIYRAILDSKYRNSVIVNKCATVSIYNTIFFAYYALLLRIKCNYLFPFPDVWKGSKIAIYGAGKVGYQLVYGIQRSGDYTIEIVCDENTNRPSVFGYNVQPVTALRTANYDFVVVAVAYENMASEMKKKLMNMGIDNKKIKLMDAKVLTKENLNRVFES